MKSHHVTPSISITLDFPLRFAMAEFIQPILLLSYLIMGWSDKASLTLTTPYAPMASYISPSQHFTRLKLFVIVCMII